MVEPPKKWWFFVKMFVNLFQGGVFFEVPAIFCKGGVHFLLVFCKGT